MKQKYKIFGMAAFALAGITNAATYSNTTLYVRNVGSTAPNAAMNNQTTLAAYDGTTWTNVTESDTVDWSSINIVYNSNNISDGNKNTWTLPTVATSGDTFTLGGNYEFTNFMDASKAYPNAFGIWKIGVGSNIAASVLNITGTLKFTNANFNNGDQDYDFSTTLHVGALEATNTTTGTMTVNFGNGTWQRAFKGMTVDDDLTISGLVNFYTNIKAAGTVSAESPDISIGGQIKMSSSEAGSPLFSVGHFDPHVVSIDGINTAVKYITAAGIDGVGTFQTNNDGVGERVWNYYTLNTVSGETSDLAGTFVYNGANGTSRTFIAVNGAGEQVFRFSDSTTERLNLTVSDSATLRVYANDTTNGRTLAVTVDGGKFGTAASDSSAANDGASIYIDSLAWNAGTLIVDVDAGAKFNIAGTFSMGTASDLSLDFTGSVGEGDIIALDDFIAWESSESATYRAELEGALSSGDLSVLVNGIEHEYTFDTSTGITLGAVVPEPATVAAIFGAIALGFAAYRRRK